VLLLVLGQVALDPRAVVAGGGERALDAEIVGSLLAELLLDLAALGGNRLKPVC
jgi:hypothetical protein